MRPLFSVPAILLICTGASYGVPLLSISNVSSYNTTDRLITLGIRQPQALCTKSCPVDYVCCPAYYRCYLYPVYDVEMCCLETLECLAQTTSTPTSITAAVVTKSTSIASPTSKSTSVTSSTSSSTSSTSSSTSITSPSSTSTTSKSSQTTTGPSTTTSTSSSTSMTSTASPAPTQASAIVGPAVGVVGTAAVATGVAFMNAHHFPALAYLLFGLFFFRGRRLIMRTSEHLQAVQITLFLTLSDSPHDFEEGDPIRPLVWQTFELGGAQTNFPVNIPCVNPSGAPCLGYGTIEDHSSFVTCLSSEAAPAILKEDGDSWQRPEGYQNSKKKIKKKSEIYVQNDTNLEHRIALGTFDQNSMRPFLLIEHLRIGEKYGHTPELYLHAYRTTNYKAGQYADKIFGQVRRDRLMNPIKVTSLSPITTWYLRSFGDGRLALKIGKNQDEDVKAFKHECTIDRSAKAPRRGATADYFPLAELEPKP